VSSAPGYHATKPLDGVRVLELAGLGPVPYAGQLLADMGAEVISVARKGQLSQPVEDRGKRSLVLNLKNPVAIDAMLKLVERVDVLIEGYRPGVTERLGIGPSECLQRSPQLVYGRMTGWGQHGPWSQKAGHDINSIGLTGVLNALGEAGRVPPPPIESGWRLWWGIAVSGQWCVGSFAGCTRKRQGSRA